MRRITIIAAAFCAVLSNAAAQSLEEIKERARALEEYKSLIKEDADPTLRLAAIEHGLKSKDDLMRRAAFDATLDSDNADLVFLGLRHLFKQRTQMTMELTLPDEPTKAQQNTFNRYAQTTFSKLDVLENGEISFSGGYKGAFITKGFILNWGNCNLKIASVSKEVLSGTYACGADDVLVARILID